MNPRYEAYVTFLTTLEAVRWNLIGLACVFGLGRLVAGLLPQKWIAPVFEVAVLLVVYGFMLAGLLQ